MLLRLLPDQREDRSRLFSSEQLQQHIVCLKQFSLLSVEMKVPLQRGCDACQTKPRKQSLCCVPSDAEGQQTQEHHDTWPPTLNSMAIF